MTDSALGEVGGRQHVPPAIVTLTPKKVAVPSVVSAVAILVLIIVCNGSWRQCTQEPLSSVV